MDLIIGAQIEYAVGRKESSDGEVVAINAETVRVKDHYDKTTRVVPIKDVLTVLEY